MYMVLEISEDSWHCLVPLIASSCKCINISTDGLGLNATLDDQIPHQEGELSKSILAIGVARPEICISSQFLSRLETTLLNQTVSSL